LKNRKTVYIETYGCQMNVSDSEIVASILTGAGYIYSRDLMGADIILINTCSIRENAEVKVRRRLQYFRSLKNKNHDLVIGLLGCMAERIKTALIEEENLLDLIAGPDSYRDLPKLLTEVGSGHPLVNTILSQEETYADIIPVRFDKNGISGFISIMRGCENFCSYCVVPSTRGKERSRDINSILHETQELFNKGYREVTFLGQNVNSYRWSENGTSITFAELLARAASLDPFLRIRFATSHPKDLPDELLMTIAYYPNICKAIHLPLQSGSNKVLDRMNRKYTREQYLQRINAIRQHIPGCAISTDIIVGFCGETEEDHRQTLSLMEDAGFDFAYMFKYSERKLTLAAETFKDDIPDPVKERRLHEVIRLQQELSLRSNKLDVGKNFEVLIEGESKRSKNHFSGRTSQNKVVVFPKTKTEVSHYVNVKILSCTSATLIGEVVQQSSTG